MLSINTNKSSLIAQNSMKSSTNKLNQAIERMTTGAKINHAKDNAANYSIATNMTTKINAYQVAEDNCAMGLDMMTTAMESLDLVSNHLSRIRDLAVQASNGTYSGKSLNAIQSEISARLAESARIIEDSSFNGISLFQASNNSNSKFIKEVVQLSEQEAIAQGYTVIKTADELQAMQDNLSGKYILMNDIDLDGYDWTAIGTNINPFIGIFNGNGFTIKNLTINKPDKDYQGLFGFASLNATFLNIGLENINIVGHNDVAGLVGYKTSGLGTIDNCFVTGIVSGNNTVGGLAGYIDIESISSCRTNTNVTGSDRYIGGIVAWLEGDNLINCYSTGDTIGGTTIGGVVGYKTSTGKIKNCFTSGNITGKNQVGGVIGTFTNGTIEYSYSTGNVTGYEGVGGFAGYAPTGVNANINNCSTLSIVTGKYGVGAFIGETGYSGNLIITNSGYNTEINPTLSAIPRNRMSVDESGIISNLLEPILQPSKSIINFQIGTGSNSDSTIIFDLEFTINLDIDTTNLQNPADIIENIDNLFIKINKRKTQFGSAYNRLESAIESIIVFYDNLVSSRSTIQDADIAEVSSEYIKMQILQQASATLMATANQSPSIALQLL